MATILRVYDASMNPVGDLPDAVGVTQQVVFNDMGSLTASYPRSGKNADLLDLPVAYLSVVTDGVEGTERYLLDEDSDQDDNDPNRAITISARSYVAILEHALVYPEKHTPGANPNGMDPVHKFSKRTPGHMLNQLLAKAQARGCFPDLTWSFSGYVDSAGVSWPKSYTMSFPAGQNYLDVLRSMVESDWVDFTVVGNELKLYVKDTALTADAPGVIYRLGKDCQLSTRARSRRGLGNAILGVGDEKNMLAQDDSLSISQFGRRELLASDGRMVSDGSLPQLVSSTLSRSNRTKEGFSITVPLGEPGVTGERMWKPGVDFSVGNKIRYDQKRASDTTLTPLQVRSISYTWATSESPGNAVIEFEDLFVKWRVRQSRIMRGISLGGTGAPTTGTLPPSTSVIPDSSTPLAPTAVTLVESLVYSEDERYRAQAAYSWTPPIENTDGSDLTDLAYYAFQWQVDGGEWSQLYQTEDATAVIQDLRPGASVVLRVRAVDTANPPHASTWGVSAPTVMPIDNDPPPKPSTPVLSSRLGVVTVNYDGLTSVGGSMPADFARVVVHADATDPAFTPSAATVVGYILAGASQTVVADLPYGTHHFRLVAFDTGDNASDPSDAATVEVKALVDTDVIGQVLDGANLIDGSLGPAALADASIGSDKLADLVTPPTVGGTPLITTVDAQAQADLAEATAIAEAAAVENRAISRGTDLVTNGTGSLGDATNFYGFTFDGSDAPPGSVGCFAMPKAKSTVLRNEEFIPLDASKKYRIQAWLRQRGTATGMGQYVRAFFYDSAQELMNRVNHDRLAGTETTLAQPLNPGDTTVYLTSAAGWNPGLAYYYTYLNFYDYTDTLGRSWADGWTFTRTNYQPDYNSQLTAFTAADTTANTLTLRSPYSGAAKPAGTKIAQGLGGDASVTGVANNAIPTATWTAYSATLTGLQAGATRTNGEIPHGAAYVRLGYYANYSGTDYANSDVAVGGVSVSDASAAAAEAAAANYAANNITETQITTDAITAPKIKAGAVIAGKLAANSVVASNIKAGEVRTQHLTVSDTANMAEVNETYSIGLLYDTTHSIVNGWSTRASNASQYFMFRNQRGPVPFKTGDRIRVTFEAFAATSTPATAYLWAYGDASVAQAIGAAFTIGTTPTQIAVEADVTLDSNLKTAYMVGMLGGGLNGTNVYVRNVRAYRMGAGELIVDGSIVAKHIAANAVEADKIKANAVTASKVAAQAIGTDHLAAGAVTTAKLDVGALGENKQPNPYFEEADTTDPTRPAGWATMWWGGAGATFSFETASPIQGAKSLRLTYAAPADYAEVSVPTAIIPVNEGEQWRFKATFRASRSVAGRKARVKAWASQTKADNGSIFNSPASILASVAEADLTSANTTLEGVYTVPAGYKWLRLSLENEAPNDAAGGYAVVWDEVVFQKRVVSAVIADGAISTPKLAALAVQAGNIAANAVSTDKLEVGAVTAEKIALGTFGTNLVPDPSFEQDYAFDALNSPSAPVGRWRHSLSGGATLERAMRARSGLKSLRMKSPAAGGSAWATSGVIPVTPGKTYNVQFSVAKEVNADLGRFYGRIAGGSTTALTEYPATGSANGVAFGGSDPAFAESVDPAWIGTNLFTGDTTVDSNGDGIMDGGFAYTTGTVTGGARSVSAAGQRITATSVADASRWGVRVADIPVIPGARHRTTVKYTGYSGTNVRLRVYVDGIDNSVEPPTAASMGTLYPTAAPDGTATFDLTAGNYDTARVYVWFENLTAGTVASNCAVNITSVQLEQIDANGLTDPEAETFDTLSGEFTVPAGINYVAVRLILNTTSAAQSLFVDDVSLIEKGIGGSELTAAGLRLFGSEGTEVAAFVSNRANYFSVTKSGDTLASISDDGGGSFQTLDVRGTDIDGDGVTETGFRIYGTEFLEWFDNMPRGVLSWENFATDSTSTTGETGYGEIGFTAEPGRLYKVNVRSMIENNSAASIVHRLRLTYADAPGTAPSPAVTSPILLVTNVNPEGASVLANADYWFSDWTYLYNETTTPRHVRILGTHQGGAGTTTVIRAQGNGSSAITNPEGGYMLSVEDVGPYRGQGGAYNTGGATVSPVQTYTKTWTSTNACCYMANGSKDSQQGSSDMKQGYSSYDGDSRSLWTFPSMTSTLSGATITRIRVYLYANHWYYNSGGTARIKVHGYSSIPGSSPSLTTAIDSKDWPKPGGRWVTLPSSLHAGFISGAYKGIGVGPAGSTSQTYYGRFNKSGAKIEVVYKK